MNENFDVSVVIPTYNRQNLLVKVLPSYLNQKHVKEIILINDGSDIAIQQTLKEMSVSDERIRFIRHNRNLGSCSARNAGIFEARTQWIFFGEDDLVLSDDYIENLHKDRIKLGADIILRKSYSAEEMNGIL